MGIDMRSPLAQELNTILLKLLEDYTYYKSQSVLGARYTSLDEYIAKAIRSIDETVHKGG